MFLLLIFLPLLNFNLEAYSKDKIFIYKSPPVDFMLLKNIKKLKIKNNQNSFFPFTESWLIMKDKRIY